MEKEETTRYEEYLAALKKDPWCCAAILAAWGKYASQGGKNEKEKEKEKDDGNGENENEKLYDGTEG